MAQEKEIEISTKIQSINLISFKTADNVLIKLDKDKFVFEHGINVKISPGTKEIVVHSTTTIFAEIEKLNYLGEIETSGIFELLNFNEVTSPHNGNMPNGILAMYIGVLLSTTRGFLILKSQGTIIEDALIPIIDAGKFFTKP